MSVFSNRECLSPNYPTERYWKNIPHRNTQIKILWDFYGDILDKTGESFLRRLQIIGRELIISKPLRKPSIEYTRLYPHVSAGINLTKRGKVVKRGETVDFVYVNTRRHNPL